MRKTAALVLKITWLAAVLICLFSPNEMLRAESNPSNFTVKTKNGLQFEVPEDWPIEERNGTVGPIPIEEYLAKKFNEVSTKLRTLEQQHSSLELRFRVLEEQSKKQRVKLETEESLQ